MPWLDQILHKNRIWALFSKARASYVLKFAMDRIRAREEVRGADPERKGHERDFLGRFLDIRDKDPNIPDSYALTPG